jgi:FlaA1/EpsC-like NDP-sugar epimerase
MLTITSLSARLLNNSSFVNMPISVIVIFAMLLSTLLILSRLVAKMVFQYWFVPKKDVRNLMIFGAGTLGQATLNALLSDTSVNIKIIGFIDDNVSLQGKYLLGVPIYSVENAFKKIIPENKVAEIIFAIDKNEISYKRKREITDKCLELHLVLKEVPPVKSWIKGELQAKTIRSIKIEDLLGRNSIKLTGKK